MTKEELNEIEARFDELDDIMTHILIDCNNATDVLKKLNEVIDEENYINLRALIFGISRHMYAVIDWLTLTQYLETIKETCMTVEELNKIYAKYDELDTILGMILNDCEDAKRILAKVFDALDAENYNRLRSIISEIIKHTCDASNWRVQNQHKEIIKEK